MAEIQWQKLTNLRFYSQNPHFSDVVFSKPEATENLLFCHMFIFFQSILWRLVYTYICGTFSGTFMNK